MENLLAVLDGDHAATGEARAIAAAVHFVVDGMIGIAGAQEVRVQGMHAAILHRGNRGGQRLPQYLPAENPAMPGIAAFTAKPIGLQALQAQHLQQVGEDGIHQ
jgi:hypothetical protein